jgi:hypothetical protein
LLGFSLSEANDAVTALLAVAVASILRGIWSLQQRISRLEGLDEMRERKLDTGRGEEATPSDRDLTLRGTKEE